MNNLKYLIVIFSLLVSMFYFGCESNDALPTNTNPPPSIDTSKKVLVEFFTNAGCIPCVNAHHYLDQITGLSGVTFNDTNVIIISTHTQYPSPADSIYRANTVQSNARTTYYGINFTPQCRLDGTTMGQFSSNDWTSQINADLQTTKYLNFVLSNIFISSNDSGVITSNISVASALPSVTGNVIHVVITENNVSYVTAQNGITHPNDVMRSMVTGNTGQPITLTTGQTNTVVTPYKLNSNWVTGNCYITVFIQNTDTKQVLGVERIKVN
jgi:hypothetical protein